MKHIKKTTIFPVIVVFFALMSIVVVSFFTTSSTLSNDKAESLDEQTQIVEDKILDRFDLFDEKLRSGVGLFSVEDTVSRQEWSTFVSTSSEIERFTGAQGIGYAKFIKPNEIDSFEDFAKTEYYPDFNIFPTGEREIYTAITVIQPDNESNNIAIGYDMYSESIRKNAMDLARDTGNTHISNSVLLLQGAERGIKPGFLMYTPHYKTGSSLGSVEERRQNIEGFVYAVFESEIFFGKLLY